MKAYGRKYHKSYDSEELEINKSRERREAKKKTEEQADEYIFLDWDTGKCDWSPPIVAESFDSIEDWVYEQILLDEYLMTDFEEPNENNS